MRIAFLTLKHLFVLEEALVVGLVGLLHSLAPAIELPHSITNRDGTTSQRQTDGQFPRLQALGLDLRFGLRHGEWLSCRRRVKELVSPPSHSRDVD